MDKRPLTIAELRRAAEALAVLVAYMMPTLPSPAREAAQRFVAIVERPAAAEARASAEQGKD